MSDSIGRIVYHLVSACDEHSLDCCSAAEFGGSVSGQFRRRPPTDLGTNSAIGAHQLCWRGFEATSLDALAASLGITKQTILHHFRSKDQLLSAVIDRTAKEFAEVIDERLASKPSGWPALEAVVRAIFGLAGRRPELLGLLREVGRLGPEQNTELAQRLSPLIDRATSFLGELDSNPNVRKVEPRTVVLAAYAAVLGVVTEAEVLRQLGQSPSARLLLRRRRELLRYMADLLGVDHP
jgi:TetR/AcrR family transcriptional regulator